MRRLSPCIFAGVNYTQLNKLRTTVHRLCNTHLQTDIVISRSKFLGETVLFMKEIIQRRVFIASRNSVVCISE